MTKKILSVLVFFFIILHLTDIRAEEIKYIEIFDPKQDKVVHVTQLNSQINNMVSSWIKNIDGIYGKIDPVTNDGYAIKVPLNPAIDVHGKYLNALVDVVYIIIPENDPPFFMIFENKNRLSCFPFNGDIDALSKILDFKLKNR